jgi:hypothetical protein
MSKLRESARGEACTLQLHPYCLDEPSTVVLCHIGKSGYGQKSSDMLAVYGCHACHQIIDQRVKTDIPKAELLALQINALGRTHQRMIDKGVITIGKKSGKG